VQIVLGILLAAIVGIVAHYALPHRTTRGVAVAPLLAAGAGAVVWTVLTWAGWGIDNPLLWLAAVVVPAAVTLPVVLFVSRARADRDAAERARLRIG
jgi:uncharacterized membrane protein YeaQ/YmgE (transglycosylase-associated protein family)